MKINLNTIFTFSLLILLFISFEELSGQTSGTMTLTYTQTAASGTATKNVLAVWIEDANGNFVKTRYRFVASGTKDHLPSWAVKSGGTASNATSTSCNIVDAVTGATRTSSTSPTAFGVQTVSWNGTNTSGVVVADGTYNVLVESAWANPEPAANTHKFLSTFTFTKGSSAITLNPTDANLSSITLTWTPVATTMINAPGISGNSFCQGVSLSVPFTSTGTYNSGNVFSAQLSNSSGSFANPTTIGTLTSSSSGTINAVIPANSVSGNGYRIRVIASNPPTTGNDNGSNISINATVNPSVQISTPANIVCNNSNVTFTALPTNGGVPTYSWKLNNLNVGTNSSSFTTSTLNNGDSVYCIMNSTASCVSSTVVTSNKIQMTVQSNLIASIGITASSQNICSGDTVSFTANPVNGGNPSYLWKLNQNVVGNNASFSSSNLSNLDSIYCIMTSSLSCVANSSVNSNKIGITVNPVVNAQVSYSSNQSLTTCYNDTLVLTAIPIHGGVPAYVWKLNGLNVGTNQLFSHVYNSNSKVELLMTSSESCAQPKISSYSDSVKVFPYNPVTISSTSTQLSASGGVSFQWYNQNSGIIQGANAQTYTPTSSGYYYCEIVDNNSCKYTSNTLYFSIVGISNINGDDLIKIFPNPTEGSLTIISANEIINPTIKVLNVFGQEVVKILGDQTDKNRIDINNSELKSGIYFLEIEVANQKVLRKIIIN